MPGAGRSESKLMQSVGALVAAVAVVGWLLFDWSFGTSGGPVPIALGVLAVVLAVAATAYRR